MRRLASQLYVGLAAFDVTTWPTQSAGCKGAQQTDLCDTSYRVVQ